MTGAQALARVLQAHGTRFLFGIPGVHTLPLYDALADYPALRPIVTRHEAGATIAADGYARVSGQPGVVSVVPGPGALNAATGVLCAWSDRVPMIVLTVELDRSDRRAAVHECDLEAAYRPFTKGQLRVQAGMEVGRVVGAAFALAVQPPAGPVQILIPARVLGEEGTDASERSAVRDPSPVLDATAKVLAFLRETDTVALILGLGVAGMAGDAATLLETLGAPAFTDVAARGLLPEDHPWSAGLLSWPGAQPILDACDAVLVLGSRLSEISTLNWSVRLPSRLARVDADARELDGNYPAALAIQADPAAVLHGLAGALAGSEPRPAARPARALAEARAAHVELRPASGPGGIHPRAAVLELRAILPRDAIVTTDGTATEFWLSEPSFPVLAPGGFLVPEVQQSMGYGLAAAIGAALAASQQGSDRPIVCITGDGSFQMLLGELATAAGLERQLTVVVYDDGYYNALRIYQDGLYGRQVGVKLRNPDFELLARAYGATAERVERIDDLRPAIQRAITANGLSILAIAIDPAPLPDRYARRLRQMAPAGDRSRPSTIQKGAHR
jgi:thiamine pyrophosphate-dependent acetolactate synthase large subunit-like protein